jgi:hypothetical protein
MAVNVPVTAAIAFSANIKANARYPILKIN